MKIIKVDNFDRDTVDDELLAEKVPKIWAERIVACLNDKLSTNHGPNFFRAVEDDYELKKWEP